MPIVMLKGSTVKPIDALDSNTITMMTQKELLNLAECYIAVEGYTDLRSILSVMSQEYPGEFDRKQAIQAIHEALKAERRS